MTWKAARNGQIPDGATKLGQEANGEPLYLARASYEGGVHLGKLRLDFGGVNIPYGGNEVTVADYEVFCGKAAWEHASDGQIPDGALKLGEEANGDPLFAARASYQDGVHIGKVRLDFRGANIPYGGKEVAVNPYEVLVASE